MTRQNKMFSHSPDVPAARVLIVDDDEELSALFVHVMESRGIEVRSATTAKAATDWISRESFDGVLLDVLLGDDNGLNAMQYIISEQPRCKIMVLTAHSSVAIAVEAMRRGATGFFTKDKGCDRIVDELMGLLNLTIVSDKALGAAILANHGMLGASSAIRQVIGSIDRMAAVDSTVLITGESGTGKELVARGLHSGSSRKEQPFAAINCGAIPENLLESELFGHRRGSFTDAKFDRKGIFEMCADGTLLLDEIGDMPLPLQVKLLRVLQDREIRPVGGNEAIRVATRVIAATHRNLEEEARAGRFRWDLYYRLSVLHVDIPPLRQRREDIPVLVEHFLKVFNERFERKVQFPRPEIMARLQAYHWPGNVRELQNTLERGVVLSKDHELSIEDLFIGHGKPIPVRNELTADVHSTPLSYHAAKETFERQYVTQLLRYSGGNVSEAARISGQCRPQLYRILNRLGMNPDEFKGHSGSGSQHVSRIAPESHTS